MIIIIIIYINNYNYNHLYMFGADLFNQDIGRCLFSTYTMGFNITTTIENLFYKTQVTQESPLYNI